MADLVPAVRINKPDIPGELGDLYFPESQGVAGKAYRTTATITRTQLPNYPPGSEP